MKSYDEYQWPLRNPDHKPFDHQVKTTEFLLRNKRAFVLSDVGTGKTLCALWATDILLSLGKIKKVLIITPLSTVEAVWAKEIFSNFVGRTYAVAHGNPETRSKAIKASVDYVIINHDGIKFCYSELIAEKFDVVIIDELTAYKNSNSDRTKVMYNIAVRAKSVWGMTGILTPNSPTEAYSQAKIVNPNNPFLPRYYGQFKRMVESEVAPHVFVVKPDAQTHVYAITQPSVRFERDKCLDLPPAFYQNFDVGMSKEQKEAYEAVKEKLYYEYDSGEISATNAGVKFVKLLQIMAGSVKDDDGRVYHLDATPKVDSILQSFEEVGQRKLIVVSAFRASVERLCQVMLDKKIKCRFIHGEVNSDERNRVINEFQSGQLQMLILQPQAVAHGITLTASNMIVWQSYITSGETYMQMNGRIIRASQVRKQYIRRLIGSKTDAHAVNMLEGKHNVALKIMGLFADRDL
jgi:SNF2 family DNA or RNA helicase